MKIVLIEQVRPKKTKSNVFEKNLLTSFSILPTLYVRRLAVCIPKEHEVRIINERYNAVQVPDDVDVVIIHFTTASAYRAYQIADLLRKRGFTIVLCGLHASALPDEALQHADSILLGRGEGNVLNLLEDLEKDRLRKMYPPRRYETVSVPPTNVHLPGFVLMGAVEATRGCPYQCRFCPEANTPMGSSFYKRPVKEIIDEIRQIPHKIIMFYDASLTINPAFTKELFQQMKSLNKRFFCNGNVDTLSKDEELVKLSHQAGCIAWLVGFESVSQKTIDAVGKSTNVIEKYGSVVDLIHQYKMAVIGDFMFGFDSDTPSVFDNTLTFIRKLRIDVADFSILTPFPGTPLFDQFDRENRLITRDWSKYSMNNVVFRPKQMSPDELKNGVNMLYQSFYQPLDSMRRISIAFTSGLYPGMAVFSRHLISLIARSHLSASSK